MHKLYETIENEINERFTKSIHMFCQFKELTDEIKNSHMTGIKSKEFRTVE
jgi:hypothetical protein